MRWLVVLALVAAGCPPPRQYAVERPGLDCARATRVAHRTLVTLGYTVTALVEASPERAGYVAGTKTGSDGRPRGGRVSIRCVAEGAVLQPIEEGLVPESFEFSRGFGYSFKSLVQRPDVEQPWKSTGLQVLVEALDAFRAQLDLGGVPTQGGAVALRVTVRNDTDRRVILDVPRLALVDPAGNAREPLAGSALSAAIAPGAAGDRVRAELFGRQPIAAGETRVGFAVYPPGTYREARVAIEDVETEETEGFVAPVE